MTSFPCGTAGWSYLEGERGGPLQFVRDFTRRSATTCLV